MVCYRHYTWLKQNGWGHLCFVFSIFYVSFFVAERKKLLVELASSIAQAYNFIFMLLGPPEFICISAGNPMKQVTFVHWSIVGKRVLSLPHTHFIFDPSSFWHPLFYQKSFSQISVFCLKSWTMTVQKYCRFMFLEDSHWPRIKEN